MKVVKVGLKNFFQKHRESKVAYNKHFDSKVNKTKTKEL